MTARPSSDVGGAAPADSEWTRWTTGMHLLVTDPTVLSRARAIVDAELDAVEDAASRFRPDSEICALAAAAGARTPVSPVLADLIGAALTAARLTDGDVDPTVGRALVDLGYDRDIDDIDPAAPRVAQELEEVIQTLMTPAWVQLNAKAKPIVKTLERILSTLRK